MVPNPENLVQHFVQGTLVVLVTLPVQGFKNRRKKAAQILQKRLIRLVIELVVATDENTKRDLQSQAQYTTSIVEEVHHRKPTSAVFLNGDQNPASRSYPYIKWMGYGALGTPTINGYTTTATTASCVMSIGLVPYVWKTT